MPLNQNTLKDIITDPNKADIMVNQADELGKKLKNIGLATNQIRALFGEVRQIDAQWKIDQQRATARRRLILLKPKLRYRARRERGQAVKELVDVLEPALDIVIQEKDEDKKEIFFHHFLDFFEAILAYHKSYGGN